ncbi:hypothetical protein [Mesorhizobium sp.]|uniref:hypothetical protein n=1 Tax=Mesorhizobium sp. TaxID=1871066 RepID=UPI000FE70A87|nr:hypothetical protein [Mesorhizobium sp.]RWO81522.1 MAG: hypothetical protein EOQ95_28210 [Mesorhizobium sp.]
MAIIIPERYFHVPKAHRRPKEPSAKKLRELASKWITNLRASKTGREAERHALADLLEACEPLRRCYSAACPRCSAAAQRWAMEELADLWPEETDLVSMTMIVAKLHRPIGELATIELSSIKRHLQRKFEAAEVSAIPIWGYIDISHNVHADGLYDEHWAPHLAFVTLAGNERDLDGLKASLERNNSSKRPHRVDEVNDWDWQVSYVCKFRPARRVEFEKLTPRARPSKYWLQPAQTVEFLLWAGQRHPLDRFFLLGMRRYRDGLQLL